MSTSAEIVPFPLEGQAALFEDPSRLLQLGDGEWAQLVAQAKIATGPAVAQLRRVGGLLAWAGWHRLSERNYSGLITDLADHFGVDDSTIRRWRRKVVAAEHLAVPALAQAKVAEATAAAQKTRNGRSAGGSGHSAHKNPAPRTENREPRTSVRRVEPVRPPRVAPVPASRADLSMPAEAWPAAPLQHLGEICDWLTSVSTADIRATPSHLRASLMGAMRRWIRELENDPAPSVADCPHPPGRRIGGRCAACGGKP